MERMAVFSGLFELSATKVFDGKRGRVTAVAERGLMWVDWVHFDRPAAAAWHDEFSFSAMRGWDWDTAA